MHAPPESRRRCSRSADADVDGVVLNIHRRRPRTHAPWALFAFAFANLSASAHGDVDGSRYQSNKEWGVRISAPANWDITQQTSYPNILLWMYRSKPEGRMLLTAECVTDKVNSKVYAERTAEALASFEGDSVFTVARPQLHAATGAYWIEFDNGKNFLRQALLVSGNIGYSLTLSASEAQLRRKHVRAWDYALRSLRIDRKNAQKACGYKTG